MNKKGQVNAIGPSIIALVIAGVFLILGLVILQEMRDTDIISEANTGTITNESGWINNSGYTLARSSIDLAFANPSIIAIYNGTVDITSTNYTLTGNVLTNATAATFVDVNISYTYTYADEAYESGNTTLVGLGTFADFWEIIVLAIVITVVIGLLLVVFGGRSRR